MLSDQFGRDDGQTGYDIESSILTAQLGFPFNERVEFFLLGEYQLTTATMEEWHLEATFPTPDALETDPTLEVIFREWEPVNEYSDVDVSRLDLSAGTRIRSPWGVDFEVFYTATDYDDDDPILENHTGEYSSFTGLVSKRF